MSEVFESGRAAPRSHAQPLYVTESNATALTSVEGSAYHLPASTERRGHAHLGGVTVTISKLLCKRSLQHPRLGSSIVEFHTIQSAPWQYALQTATRALSPERPRSARQRARVQLRRHSLASRPATHARATRALHAGDPQATRRPPPAPAPDGTAPGDARALTAPSRASPPAARHRAHHHSRRVRNRLPRSEALPRQNLHPPLRPRHRLPPRSLLRPRIRPECTSFPDDG